MNKINVVGSMPGFGLTDVEKMIIENADVIFAGTRNIELLNVNKKIFRPIKKLDTALDEIKNEFNKNKNIVVIASGNPLFYGIGTALIRNFGAEYINIVPHIGSIDVALSKLKIPINTVHAISVHGRPIKGLAQRIKHYKRVIILTDKINSPDKIAGYMIEYGLTNFRFIVLERLGYNDEKIRCFNIKDALNSKFSDPNLIFIDEIENFSPDDLSDKNFSMINENITKEEIRHISVSKMAVKNGDIIWDIGSGTGSVSIEACRYNYDGGIYCIEKNSMACNNIEKNMKKFSCDLNIINGEAPDALYNLPDPDIVFIGGSGGKIAEILDYSYKRLKKNGRIVINTVLIGNLNKIISYLNNNKIGYDLTQALINRNHTIKNDMMLKPVDPVFILTAVKK